MKARFGLESVLAMGDSYSRRIGEDGGELAFRELVTPAESRLPTSTVRRGALHILRDVHAEK